MSLSPGARIGAYEILAPLGKGGMGEVTLAHDTRLGRRVALKSLTEERNGNPSARRQILHEARAIASLNHPNIAAVYDVLDIDEQIFIVMEFVEGETLSARLARAPLSIGEAIVIVGQLIGALAFAHAQGVVHRDLKPGNLILTAAGTVKVLDFGLARIPILSDDERAATDTMTLHTFSGQMVGTPGYSAPEQLIGAPTDHRADIYACGVVLFEMLAGRKAFDFSSRFERVAAAVSGAAPSARQFNPSVSQSIDRVVMKAMSREPDDRFQSAEEFANAIRDAVTDTAASTTGAAPAPRVRGRWDRSWIRIAAAFIVVALLGFAAVSRLGPVETPSAPGGPASVAVLPLDNLSGDVARDFVGLGMAETISTGLAAIPALAVVSPADARRSRASADSPAATAAALGVSYLVRGSVQQAGDQLGVNLQLLDAAGRVMWADRFEGRLADLFDLQRRMGEGIGGALRVKTDAAVAPARPGATEPGALAEYWQGRILLDRPDLPGNLNRAVEAFHAAIAADKDLALAHAGLGEAYWLLYTQTKQREWTDKAIASGLEAVRLAPDEPQARYALAVIYQGSGRTEDAMEELRRVQALRPSHVDAPRLLGTILADRGRIDDAVLELNKAIALRPGYVENYSQLGLMLFNANRFKEAERAFTRVATLAPESPRGYAQLGTLYQTVGDQGRALEAYRKSVALGSTGPAFSNMGTILYAQGRYSEAAQAYRQAIALSPSRAITHRNLGDAYARLDRGADARAAYQRAVELTEAELRVNAKDAQNLSRLAVYEAKLSRFADARRHLAEASRIVAGDGAVLFRTAVVESLAGNTAAAMRALQSAVAKGYSTAVVRDDDDLAPLRELPAFRALVQQNDRS